MQQLNDDMDDLVRRAAEQYPLKTSGADWDKVLRDLDTQPLQPEETRPAGGGRKRRNLLWLLLLLPLLYIGAKLLMPGNKPVTGNGAETSQTSKPAAPADATAGTDDGKSKANTATESDKESKPVTAEETPATAEKNAAAKSSPEVKENTKANDNTEASAKPVKTKQVKLEKSSDLQALTGNKQGISATGNSQKDRQSKQKTQPGDHTVTNPSLASGKPAVSAPVTTPGATAKDTSQTTLNSTNKNTVDKKDDTTNTTVDNNQLKTTAPVQQKEQEKQSPSTATVSLKEKPADPRHFYVGLLTGPDLSTIKLTSLNAGYGAGAILGYRFNNHWAVEGGFFWSNKNYYADGKDFSTKKLTMLPQHTNILNVDGSCYMYELPLNVNYYFGKESGYNWFVNAGVSSYLMNKEDYSYVAERYNVEYTWSRSYKSSSKDWFSTLNIGAGYEKQIGKSGKLRLQPYFRIPIRGAGTGSLPITSTGFYIGYTQKLF